MQDHRTERPAGRVSGIPGGTAPEAVSYTQRDASQPTGSDTGESRPAEPESYETRARRMLADRSGADIDASTAIRALADRLRLDPDPDPGQAARYIELALRAGRKTRAEQARRESERSRELHDYRASHGGSCFAGNWQLEQAE